MRVLLGVLGVAALFGLRGGVAVPSALAGDPCYHGFDMPALTVGERTDIKPMPCAFEPTVATIAGGESVTFSNGSGVAHLVTGANQALAAAAARSGGAAAEVIPGGAGISGPPVAADSTPADPDAALVTGGLLLAGALVGGLATVLRRRRVAAGTAGRIAG